MTMEATGVFPDWEAVSTVILGARYDGFISVRRIYDDFGFMLRDYLD